MSISIALCGVVVLREDKSLTAVGDQEYDFSIFFEVELLGDELPWLEK